LCGFWSAAFFFLKASRSFCIRLSLGAGRFAKIGIPAPEIMGPFVGGCEISCGALLIIGLLTRLAAMVLPIDISVAIVSTKIPVLLGRGFWGLSLSKLPRYGFLEHDARGAHGFFHVARTAFPAHHWCRQKMVSGCSDCVGKQQLS